MRRGVAFPFLVLGDKALRAGKWQLFTEGDGLVESEDHIPDWDYATTLRVHRSIEIDFPLASAQLAIPQDELRLSVVLRVATGPGNIPHVIEVVSYPLSGPGSSPIVINQAIESPRLSRRLKLVTEVVLDEPPSRPSQLSPTVRGSRLWSDEVDFRLEGQEPRFPMEAMSFREHFRDNIKAASLWYLHWNPSNLDADFRGSVRLYLNADRPDFVALVYSGDRDALQLLVSGVVSQIAERTIVDPDMDDIVLEGAPGSVAWHLRTWLNVAFPQMPLSQIRNVLEQRPGHFHAAIQGLSDVVGELT